MGVTNDLAVFATGSALIPDEMSRFTRFSLFDWATVGLAGGNEPTAQLVRKAALAEGCAGPATLIGGGNAAAATAALVNGATSHALDYDDTHFLHIGHPSVAVAPACLAVAERENASGTAMLNALAIGLEVSCRIGDWLGRSHYEAGFHQTGTAGAFGATAAAGRLMGLDASRMVHALGLTATRAAGLKSQFGTMGKPLNAGFAAEVGVTCASLAAHDVVSNPDAIDGDQGFGPTHAGSARQFAWQGIGTDWVFPGVSYKFHACCHGLHAMLEAIRNLRGDGLTADMVKSVRVWTHPRWLAVCNQPEPSTGLGAKFSFRLTAAMGLAGVDTAAIDTYDDAITQRPDLVALRDAVTVVTDESLADTQTRVTVTTTQGGVLECSHDLAEATDPAMLERRLRGKSSTLLGDDVSGALWQVVTALDDADDLAGLTSLLSR
ncbi:MmgE/PrpD family protein [Halomonas sp.]|uniref:MmgE/PrpD family protein n=1 Tax=Halomonas sp. TaxID=1486246 RepID=UPI0035663112